MQIVVNRARTGKVVGAVRTANQSERGNQISGDGEGGVRATEVGDKMAGGPLVKSPSTIGEGTRVRRRKASGGQRDRRGNGEGIRWRRDGRRRSLNNGG